MPDTDFQSLLESVQTDGFIDPIIRIHEGHILDGWHRYRAAQELNLIRRLKFQEWNEDEKKDGDPKAFVLARNIERRHLSASQRAQIVVTFNERFNRGNIDAQRNDSDSPNGEPKTRQELAQEAGVGTRTIDRAVAVDKAGQSEAVIAGEKTASEVIKENESNCKKELQRILEVQGVLNKSVYDARALSEVYNLTEARVRKLKDEVWDAAITKARERWQKSYTKVRSAWMNYEELSKTVEWETFVAATIEQVDMAFLSTETFTEADSRIKSCTDYKLLQNEADSLITLGYHLRNPSTWVSDLIPEDNSLAFDNFCNTIEKLDQAWKDANLPISFEDDFLSAAADRTNFYPDTIKELYEAGKTRQQHEEYEDYISWNKTFTIILRGLQERSHWVRKHWW